MQKKMLKNRLTVDVTESILFKICIRCSDDNAFGKGSVQHKKLYQKIKIMH